MANWAFTKSTTSSFTSTHTYLLKSGVIVPLVLQTVLVSSECRSIASVWSARRANLSRLIIRTEVGILTLISVCNLLLPPKGCLLNKQDSTEISKSFLIPCMGLSRLMLRWQSFLNRKVVLQSCFSRLTEYL